MLEWLWVETGDGERLRAWVAGPPGAEPVFLITGGASDGRAWRFVVSELCEDPLELVHATSHPSLAEDLRVAGYDQRGTGASSGAVPPESSALGAEHAGAVGSAVLGSRFHLVGESLGGMAAMRLALARPDLVASLVLVATSSGGAGLTPPDDAFLANITGGGPVDPRQRARQNLALSCGARFPEEHPDLFEALVDKSLGQPASPDAWAAQAQCFATHDVTDALPSLAVPTLVVCGTEDKVMRPPNSDYLAAAIPGAELVTLEGVGHAVDLEAPDQLAAAVSGHVRRHPIRL